MKVDKNRRVYTVYGDMENSADLLSIYNVTDRKIS